MKPRRKLSKPIWIALIAILAGMLMLLPYCVFVLTPPDRTRSEEYKRFRQTVGSPNGRYVAEAYAWCVLDTDQYIELHRAGVPASHDDVIFCHSCELSDVKLHWQDDKTLLVRLNGIAPDDFKCTSLYGVTIRYDVTDKSAHKNRTATVSPDGGNSQ